MCGESLVVWRSHGRGKVSAARPARGLARRRGFRSGFSRLPTDPTEPDDGQSWHPAPERHEALTLSEDGAKRERGAGGQAFRLVSVPVGFVEFARLAIAKKLIPASPARSSCGAYASPFQEGAAGPEQERGRA